MKTCAADGAYSSRGVTLLEVLVAVSVIIILVALVIVGVSSARQSTGHTRVLSDLRTLSVAVSDYAAVNNGRFISPAIVGSESDSSRSYFSFTESWRPEWGGGYFDADFRYPPFTRVVRARENNVPYFLSPSVFTLPEYWRKNSIRDKSMLVAPKLSSVRFPSSKTVFVSPDDDGGVSFIPIVNQGPPFHPPSFELGISLVDGSAAFVSEQSLIVPDLRGEGANEWSFWPAPMYGMHTRDGVLGRDRN